MEKRKAPGGGNNRIYVLTPRGESLRPVLEALHLWGTGIAGELPVRVDNLANKGA